MNDTPTLDDRPDSGNRITITLDRVQLPEQEQQSLLTELEEKVHRLCTENAVLDPEHVRAVAGHRYVQISDDCPKCGSVLVLRGLVADHENGAHADTECPDCGYRGTAVYRLIDHESAIFNDETGESEWQSAVNQGEVTPIYNPY